MTETTQSPAPPSTPPGGGGRSFPIAIIVLVVVAVALAVALFVATDDDDADVSSDETTTSITEPTSETSAPSSTSAPTTTAAPTTTGSSDTVSDAEAATIAWPAPAGDDAYDEPVLLVTDFATQVLGFTDPVVGPFQEGDSRSGEVEVRPVDDGPVTTVAVRRMSDDRLYVLFAATSEVEVILPTAGSAIDHPLQLEGWGRGFEGQVRVAVVDRATGEELGHDFFTAGGEGELAAFAGDLAWDNPGGGWGAVVAAVTGGDDGTTWAATALPVGFIGGD